MAHFYGTITNGTQRTSTRCGHAKSGLTTHTAGWSGAIRTCVFVEDGRDMFRIELVPWQSSGGEPRILCEGFLDAKGTAPVILRTQNVQWRDASACVPDTLAMVGPKL